MQINRGMLQLKYGALQAGYWMAYCTIYTFAAVYLLEKGFENSQVGIVIALGNILGVIAQPLFASIADASGRLSLHKLTLLLAAAALMLRIAALVIPDLILPVAVLFIVTDALIQVLQPLVNSVSVYYVNRGVELNFGLARGLGSVSYAVVSSTLGRLVERYHSMAVLVLGIVIMGMIVAVMWSLPEFPDEDAVSGDAETGLRDKAAAVGENGAVSADAGKVLAAGESARGNFFLRYPRFFVAMVGFICLFTAHFMVNNFMIRIVEPLGGTAAQMGTAMAISAVAEIPTMFLFARIVKRIPSGSLLKISALFFTLKAAAYAVAVNMPMFYIAQTLQIGGFALCVPASVYYVNEVMEEHDKFKGQAIMAAANTLGGVMGSLLGGVFLDAVGIAWALRAGVMISALGAVILLFFLTAGEKRSAASMERATGS